MKMLFLTASIVIIMLLSFVGVSNAADLTWDASLDLDGDFDWQNTGTTSGRDWQFDFSQSPVTGIDDGVTSITAAYQFPDAIAIQESFISFFGSAPPSDMTFEMWFRPADLVGEHLLFETGGGNRGMQIDLRGNTLNFLVQASDGNRASTTTVLGAGSVNQFNQLVGVAEWSGSQGGDVTIDLYLNGAAVDTDFGIGINFFDGGGHAGLGTDNGAPGLELFTALTDYDGQMALFNMYKSALTGAEITALYNAKTGGGLAADFDGDSDVDGADFLLWQQGFGTTYDATDLANWESEFGTSSPAISASAVGAVPEPTSLALLCLGLAGSILIRKNRV